MFSAKLIFKTVNKIYYLRPRYVKADFGWFSYKGKLPNFIRLIKKKSIVLFSANLIFKTVNKFYYLRPRYEMADFGWFSYMGKLLNFFRLLKKTSIVVFSAKLIFKTLKNIYYLQNLKIFLWKKWRFRLRWDSSPGLSIAGRLL